MSRKGEARFLLGPRNARSRGNPNSLMTLKIGTDHLETIRQHGSRDYPNECCGIILGIAEAEAKQVKEIIPLRNLRHDPNRAQELLPLDEPGRESERNRFLIDPRDQIRVEKDARARGLEVVGYYHSHPDHPAKPSIYDRDHAWPWYSYVIIEVRSGDARELNSWMLTEDRSRFDPERIDIQNPG